MMSRGLTLAAWLTAVVLLVFTLRRWLFTGVALIESTKNTKVTKIFKSYSCRVAFGSFVDSIFLWFRFVRVRDFSSPFSSPNPLIPAKTFSEDEPDLPTVLLLAPIHNETAALPHFLAALAGLTYPPQKLTVIFINDGSNDNSAALISGRLAGQTNWHLLPLAQNVGKAQALNLALSQFPQGDIVVVYDADERPQPGALLALTRPFTEAAVGGVSGRRAVSNALAGPAASYTTFEGLVHQWVTLRAKDSLNLAPALLGANCAYRRAALVQVGHFKPGALLEDSDLTVRLARAGWLTRFEPRAVSYHAVPATLAGYWWQHTRWARGFNEVARDQVGAILFDRRLSRPLRLELLLFSLGYLDRVALLVGVGLAMLHRRARGWLAAIIGLSLVTPLGQTVSALAISRSPRPLWRQLSWLPLFFMVDLAMALYGLWGALKQSPQRWEERRARE